MRKKLVILGSTGSIGTSAMAVARNLPERVELVGLAAGTNTEKIVKQAEEFGVSQLCISSKYYLEKLRATAPSACTLHHGEEGLIELATMPEAEMVLISIVGVAGLKPALAAIRAGKDLAIASKEILVMAGEIIMAEAQKYGVKILPVDSEHNAIFQCLQGNAEGGKNIRKITLTASGGPFRTWPKEKLSGITLKDALKHPTWQMGQKITIDSATLFNKALEMIEARWLFDVEMESVDVIVHPQSIIHSMVEYCDGSTLAQLSSPDMCFPIQYALTWPERVVGQLPSLDFASIAKLEFEPPRNEDFQALELAREATRLGAGAPAALNAANEIAVDAFITGQVSFLNITKVVEKVLTQNNWAHGQDLASLLSIDIEARQKAQDFIKNTLK